MRDTLAFKTWLRKIKNYFALHSQLHRRNKTMPMPFNGHLIVSVYFRQTHSIISLKWTSNSARFTWRLSGITFYLTAETRLNFQRPNFLGIKFDKWALVWYGYNVEILGTRCRSNRSKLAFILSPKKTCKIHLYKNGDKTHTKENYKKLFICFYCAVIL